MIVKLWPVRGGHGLANCVNYVRDEAKVMALNGSTPVDPAVDDIGDLKGVFAYVSDSRKTETDGRSYVSGYMCHPDYVTSQFEATRDILHVKPVQNDVLCYHMIQSFPEDLDISDELVHQCGMELLQKLGDYQGIVCSHIHPVTDENGELHGVQKHNHIVFNAYRMPETVDSEHPDRMKFNRCNASFEQLQKWNDEIALRHGLPIVSEIDVSHIYDWGLGDKNPTNEWRDRIRYDIKQARSETSSWDEFCDRLSSQGYIIRDTGSTLTYKAPDGVHSARGTTLGTEYTKKSLTFYWALREQQSRAMQAAVAAKKSMPLRRLYDDHRGDLYARIPLAGSDETYPIPLKEKYSKAALDSYYVEGSLYTVTDGAGNKLYTATASELRNLATELELERSRGIRETEEDKQRRIDAINQRQQEAQQFYKSEQAAQASGDYKAFFYNADGSKKNVLELSFVLASLIIGEQLGIDNKYTLNAEALRAQRDRQQHNGRIDKRLQLMADSLAIIDGMGLKTPEEMNKAVADAGHRYNYAKKAYTNTKARIEKMVPIAVAIETYHRHDGIATALKSMPDGADKDAFQAAHAEELQAYTDAASLLHHSKAFTQKDQEDFLKRYARCQEELPELEEKFDHARSELRDMKRTQWAFQMSHSADYLAGDGDYDATRVDHSKGKEEKPSDRTSPELDR